MEPMFRQPFEPGQSPGGNIRFRQSSASCGTVTVRDQDTGGDNGGDTGNGDTGNGDTGGDTGREQPGDMPMEGILDDLLPVAGGLGVLVVGVLAYYALRD